MHYVNADIANVVYHVFQRYTDPHQQSSRPNLTLSNRMTPMSLPLNGSHGANNEDLTELI